MSNSKQAIWMGNVYPVEQVKQYMKQYLELQKNIVDSQQLWAEVKKEQAQQPPKTGGGVE